MSGKVCPWCKTDKTGDVLRETFTKLGAFLGAIAGLMLGALMQEYFWGIVIGAIGGTIAGAVLGASKSDEYYRNIAIVNKRNEEARIRENAVIAHQAVQDQRPIAPPPVSYIADPEQIEQQNIATIAARQEAEMLASGQYRECPHCAELIKANAKVCRFCQRDVAVPIGANR